MEKAHCVALGLMSGTSFDGIDVALLSTDGVTISEFGPGATYPYRDEDRHVLRNAIRDAPGVTNRIERPGVLAEAEAIVTRRHVEAVRAFVGEHGLDPAGVDLIGFHGQTVFHDPMRRLTVQLGDGQILADDLGTPVVWDFRAADVAAGGEGAPLVPVYHAALAATAGLSGPIAFLNVGGVSNVSFLAGDGTLLAFDTGPGSALLDDWMRERTGRPYDTNGELSARGQPSAEILKTLMQNPFFAAPPPKSLDRNDLRTMEVATLSDEDGAATLLHFTANAIAAARAQLPEQPSAWYVCGGGRRNLELMRVLGTVLPESKVQPLEALGFDGDITEAQAFAFLAVRAFKDMPITFPSTTGAPRAMSGGRISRPNANG